MLDVFINSLDFKVLGLSSKVGGDFKAMESGPLV